MKVGAALRRDVLVRMGSSPSRVAGPPLAGEVAGAERSESPAKCSVMNHASRKSADETREAGGGGETVGHVFWLFLAHRH